MKVGNSFHESIVIDKAQRIEKPFGHFCTLHISFLEKLINKKKIQRMLENIAKIL
jgi:hypothetical protein